MSTITTISSGDFQRVVTKIALTINNAILDREDKDKKFTQTERDELARKTAQGIVDTLGICVVDQTDFKR